MHEHTMFCDALGECQNESRRVKKQSRVKTYQNVSKTCFFDTPGASKCLPKPCRSYSTKSKSVKACQNVSKNGELVRTRGVFQECQNVSIRVKTCQKAVACQHVSKRVKKVSKTCQNVSGVSKSRVLCNVSCQNVSKTSFLTLC